MAYPQGERAIIYHAGPGWWVNDNILRINAVTDLLTDVLAKFAATEAAVAKQSVAAVKSVEITEQSVVIAAEKADAEESLSAALPALEAARLALADLDKNDITEIRSFATPPEAVQVIILWSLHIECSYVL
jgi:hypothetical protein